MKKILFFFILLSACLYFCSCGFFNSTVAPTIAYIEVLDSDDNPLYDCSFSAKYKDDYLSDIEYEFNEYNEEDFEKECKSSGGGDHIRGFKNGKTWYELSSNTYAGLIKKTGMLAVNNSLTLMVQKDGYKQGSLSLESQKHIAKATIVLEKN